MKHYPSLGLRVLLGGLLLGGVITWLPVVRGALQSGYEWGFMVASGRGTGGGYPMLLALAAVTWALQYLGWRRPIFPILHAGLIGFYGLLAGVAVWVTWRSGGIVIRGDTLGFAIPIGWIGAGTLVAMWLLAVAWAMRDHRRCASKRPVATVSSVRSRALAGLAAAMVPIQLAGFGLGELHGLGNKLAVLATVAQAILVGLALRPERPRATGFLTADR